MGDEVLQPNEQLGTFSGPDGEALALVVSRTGRSVTVRDTQGAGLRKSVARISHPLSESPRVDIEDWWKARSAEWRSTLKSTALRVLHEALPEGVGQAYRRRIALTPSSVLGKFSGPEGRNEMCMTVARTGRSVAARLGDKRGQIIARAHRPTCVDPGIAFEGLYRHNTADWQQDFAARFGTALEAAIADLASQLEMAEAGR